MTKRAWLLVVLTLTMVGCDVGTKVAARRWLATKPMMLGRFAQLRYTENHQSVFGLKLSDRPELVTALDVAGVAVLAFVWWRRRRAGLVEQLAFALLVAASIGNVGDRLLRGYVVDFIYVRPWPFYWNVADALIVIAVALLMVSRPRAHST